MRGDYEWDKTGEGDREPRREQKTPMQFDPRFLLQRYGGRSPVCEKAVKKSRLCSCEIPQLVLRLP